LGYGVKKDHDVGAALCMKGGYITYCVPIPTNLSVDAVEALRRYIFIHYGDKYCLKSLFFTVCKEALKKRMKANSNF